MGGIDDGPWSKRERCVGYSSKGCLDGGTVGRRSDGRVTAATTHEAKRRSHRKVKNWSAI
ncbi:uncharacterized protein CELE_Y116A8A.150 [Caenorhabditis elegans]|uniref:Uncharacterized protein n=1 Tax=Caenorhabditis elegans TaxID=6239 RepID=H2KML2_CAEEL|nr:Uncharacterized protein CELE_Y116A8A.150 [Caenorhabditis elegans]CCE72039.1 Uncharacterized protein CELE_Y116A8A.150 [Caenorhabditis elegans]|eukprot:NP_001255903.1 Uncharacterized protein CELE_Y116A8A.150 [Caenorhabditis elegans]